MPRNFALWTLCAAWPSVPATLAQIDGVDEAGYGGTVQEGRWSPLFDGKTLTGWKTTGGRYDGHASWSVEEGAITGREGPGGEGGLIYTERAYRDFELEADAWVSYPFDSGFFLRMTPPEQKQLGAQVTVDWRPGGEVGAIYCDGFYLHQPAGEKLFKKDEWNHFKIRCAGHPMHIQAWLNGSLLTDFRIPEGSGVFAESGLIGLQVHGSEGAPAGSKVQFKNIVLRELPAAAGACFRSDASGHQHLTEAGTEAGWQSLFDGGSLAAWEGGEESGGFRVREGDLEFLYTGDAPHLATRADFRDFQLRLDFQISRGANSGLFLRAARDGSNPAFSGCEIQILDDFNWEKDTQSTLAPYQFTGGLYGSVPNEQRGALRPLGEWNTYDVTYRGSRIAVYLNGTLLYDVETTGLHVPDGCLPFERRAATGFIGLQRHAPGGQAQGEAYARFRNIFVREL